MHDADDDNDGDHDDEGNDDDDNDDDDDYSGPCLLPTYSTRLINIILPIRAYRMHDFSQSGHHIMWDTYGRIDRLQWQSTFDRQGNERFVIRRAKPGANRS